MSVFDASAEALKLGLTPINPKTLNNYATLLRSLFDHEMRVGSLEENPFARMSIKVRKEGAEDRGFTTDELRQILTAPVVVGCRGLSRPFTAGPVLINDWRFWAPMIALTTGARISEIVQLRPEDVVQTDGIWVFDFNDHGSKRLKAPSSRRKVPIHDELIRLGLLSLQERMKLASESSLLGMKIPKNGNAGAQAGNWFRERFLPSILLKKRPGTGLHSFRHAWITAAREVGMQEEIRNRLTGHLTQSVSSHYGRYPVSVLKRAIDSVKFPEELKSAPSRVGIIKIA